VAAPAEGGPDAQVRGELVVVGGCYALYDEEFGLDHVVVWPAGTRRSGEGENVDRVRVPGLGELAIGDRIDGGGGYYSRVALDERYPRLAECEISEGAEVAVLNPF